MTSKADQKFQEFTNALDNLAQLTPEKVDAAFEDLKSSTDTEILKAVVDKLEKDIEAGYKEDVVPEAERQAMIAEIKQEEAEATDPYTLAELREDTEQLQGSLQCILNIAKIKGDAASPFTKIVVEEVKKLSSEEYNLSSCLLQSLNNIQKNLATLEQGNKPGFIDRGPGPRCGNRL